MPAPARATKPQIETLALEERIRRRAYDLYVQRGNESGSELDDWLQAEEERLTINASREKNREKEPSMEFPVSKADLVRELNLSQGVVEKKTTIPILSNVLVEADGDRIHLTATDLELGIRCSISRVI